MTQHVTEIVVPSNGPGMIEVTDRIVAWVVATRVATELLTLHVKHTSASLLIQENADQEVRRDFERFLRRLVPDGVNRVLLENQPNYSKRTRGFDILLGAHAAR